MDHDVLGTSIRPKDFTSAARTHGRFFARYQFAGQFAAGKRVLDAACGSGFGSAWLARSGGSVLGVDLDDEMLREAAHWTRPEQGLPKLQFRKGDLAKPFDPGTQFDLIVSFETMEHVRDPNVCLANFSACLADGGLAIISIPNGAKELADGNWDPAHQVHFAAEDFRRMTTGCFGRVEFYSQVMRRGPAHYFRKALGLGKHNANDYHFVPGLDERAKTWLAVCRQPLRAGQ